MNRIAVLIVCGLVGTPASISQQPATAPTSGAAPAAAPAPDGDKLTQEQLDQMIAPIALYPDDLLSQILMASTYPIEVVQADRWVKANKSLTGDAQAKALESQTWDASVKSLVQFPDVLSMMSEKLDITSKIGDAFISQQKDVMDSVQRLRNKAKAAGNLQSNQQQTVTVQPAAAGSQTQTIIIQPSDPQVVYVPQYSPAVYGAWPYPAYPPYPYYPPGYVAGTALLSFGVGVACGAIWSNNAWGNCNWNGGSVNINRNTNINNSFNRNNANINRGGQGSAWKHDPSHRQGAPYGNRATAQQFGGVSKGDAAQARNDFRGRESGGQSPFGGDKAGNRGTNAGQGGPNRGASAGTRDTNNRGGAGASREAPRGGNGQMQNRQGGNGGGLGGVDRGNSTRAASDRGNASRGGGQAASRPSGGGASRPSGSGGGSRGGGGRGGGGGRR
ncbi:MAG: DUF3300 domain-containing protein [Phycisphaerales bacterium]